MTTLSKDEILRLAGSANAYQDEGVFYLEEKELVAFATLCRADLVEEIRTLKADAENFRTTIGLVDKLQLERDTLRAENERLTTFAKGQHVELYNARLELSALRAGSGEAVARLQRIAWLIGSIYVHGGFIAETANERELEKLLRENGTFWESLKEFPDEPASSPQPSAVPVVRELVEALEKSWNPQLHSNERETTARSAITKGQQWLKENTND